MNQRTIEAVGFLQNVSLTERSRSLLKMAEERGFQNKVMYAADGSEHSVPEYTMQLFCYAHTLGCPDDTGSETESYLVLALLLAMERCKEDLWSYGAKLMTDVVRRKISITRKEWDAFHALYGTFATNPDKEILLSKNMMAISFYCADLITRIISLTGAKNIPSSVIPEEIKKKYDICWSGDAITSIDNLAKAFVPQYMGQEAYSRSVLPMMTGMKRSGAFLAPARLNESGEMTANVAQHICNVIWRHCDIYNPQTEEDLGKIVLAGICSCLSMTNEYSPVYSTKKTYTENGKYSEPDRRKFNWEQYVQFEKCNQIPMAHNKNLFMASRFLLADMPEAIANAIDASGNVNNHNYVDQQMYEEPLGLYLHMASFIALYIDDLRNGG